MRTKHLTAEDRHQIQREKILEAALTQFASKGFSGTSISQIAATAGVPKSVVFYYFSSKSQIFESTFQHILHIWDSLFDISSAGDDPEAFIRRYVRRKIKLSIERPEISRLVTFSLSNTDQGSLPKFNERSRESATLLQKWIGDGKLRVKSAELLLIHIWAITEYYSTHISQIMSLLNLKTPTESDVQRFIGEASDLILNGCMANRCQQRST